ncbi:hypothetical protein KP13_00744 [Klebsiella pneumoniae subsp. pneumoniae Kp13]|nr:hypothetical protein KP13_00744 [Klebsiella pneumoniae subsp. pneumoniae Kp13]
MLSVIQRKTDFCWLFISCVAADNEQMVYCNHNHSHLIFVHKLNGSFYVRLFVQWRQR